MSAKTTPQPRNIRPEDAEAMRDCLIWLGDGRFIETFVGDVYLDTAWDFSQSKAPPHSSMQDQAVADFLRWMDGGDRLRTIGPENPYGVNIEFYSSDYGFGEAGRLECAEDMVRYYREGE